MILDKFQTHFNFYTQTQRNIKIHFCSTVPFDQKSYGEIESDNPRIDLYSKIISFVKKTSSKWRSLGQLYGPFKVVQ